MSEFQRVQMLRHNWAASDGASAATLLMPGLCVADPTPGTPVAQRNVSTIEDGGVKYQRCGGGYRVLRKKLGGD